MAITNIGDVEELLRGRPRARELHAIWEERQPIAAFNPKLDSKKARYGLADRRRIPWLEDVALGARFTAQALRAEEFLLVVDAAREMLAGWQNAGEEHATSLVHIRMDYAMALARLGFTGKARQELEPCVGESVRPQMGRRLKADVLLQLGHILREEWHESTERAAQLQTAQEALGFYRRALDSEPERLEALVHSASTTFMLAEQNEELRRQAQETARQILKLAAEREGTEAARPRTTWARATAQAILGDLEAAYRGFEQLHDMVATADLAEVRYEAQFLAEAQGRARDYFKSAFPALQLIVFAGHMPDRPGADRPVRLPAGSIDGARESLRVRLKSMGARVGLVSASAGADLLFTEVLRELGGTFHLVLPWSQEEFRRTSVAPFEPPDEPAVWGPLFDRAIEEAASTRELGQVYEPASDVGWEYMMEVTAGIALQTARVLRLDVQPMVLWNGQAGWGAGGTDSFYAFWERRLERLNVKPIVVAPPSVASGGSLQGLDGRGRACERAILHQEVKSMLFADIVGYSKLTEKAIPEFIGTFLERVGRLAAHSRHAPCSVNTWGDAVYAVFDYARDAGLFALELARMVEDGKSDWLAKGLYWESQGEVEKHALNIRIGLHTGPVVMHFDPIVRRLGFTGAHVNRAARIEPVAEPGQVFASEEFAAMAELSGAGFVCEYAGSMQLAKGYPGRHRIYRLAPRRVMALEPLAKAVHEAYCAELRGQGEVPPARNPALVSWDELSEDLRDANRAQVADIPNKLRLLGYELAPAHGLPASAIEVTDAQMEQLARREHDRWMEERRRQGWSYGSERDNARKLHPLLVEWGRLEEKEKKKDRDTIRNLPSLVERAGLRVRRLG